MNVSHLLMDQPMEKLPLLSLLILALTQMLYVLLLP